MPSFQLQITLFSWDIKVTINSPTAITKNYNISKITYFQPTEKWQLVKVKYTSWVKRYKDFLLSNTIASPFFLPDSGVGLLGKQVFWSIKPIFHRKEQNKKRDGFIDYEVKMMSFPIIPCTFSPFKVGRFYWKLI